MLVWDGGSRQQIHNALAMQMFNMAQSTLNVLNLLSILTRNTCPLEIKELVSTRDQLVVESEFVQAKKSYTWSLRLPFSLELQEHFPTCS